MYNGNYLKEGNLGHEVINLYQSDNGKFYIYLQPLGSFNASRAGKFDSILLVKGIGGGRLEIIGKAEGLEEIYSNKIAQETYIKENKITYGGVLLNKLFETNNFQQTICITFKAESVVEPAKPLYIQFGGKTADANVSVLTQVNHAKTSLKQYISSEINDKDFQTLRKVIDNKSLWKTENVKQVGKISENTFPYTMFDICGIRYNELAYSHALYHFLNTDKDFASQLAVQLLGIKEGFDEDYQVYREKENIDILIEDSKHVVIIENKIKSAINGTKKDDDKISQLGVYLKKVDKMIKDKGKKLKDIQVHPFILLPNYNDIDITLYDGGNSYQKIYYKQLHDFMKAYKSYKTDPFFKMFTDALERHTVDYDNELYEEMNALFAKNISMNR